MADDVSVLVVDDSALMRNLLTKMLQTAPGLTLGATAMNGKFALQKLDTVKPDVILLDLEMPVMNGIQFLEERKKLGITIPVIILSSVAERGAPVTMKALSLGACDFVQKPSGSISTDLHTVAQQVTRLLLAYGGAYRKGHGKKVPVKTETLGIETLTSDKFKNSPANRPQRLREAGDIEIIAIGISTGGPDALRVVFSKLDPDLKQPILVVQHMPAGFTNEFAKSLDRICPLDVTEAVDGEKVVPSHIYIAQGAKHLVVQKQGFSAVLHLTTEPPVSGHRPSADVLFASVAMSYKNHALGVIMTGMGKDGAQQLGTLYREGGLTLGQDEKTAVVYGMPRVAWEMGHVMEQVPLELMGQRICQVAKTHML
jgi:two-component system chemotaxis response regulator CheB